MTCINYETPVYSNLNELSKYCRERNDKWWYDINGKKLDRNKGELMMLMVSEIAEAMEGVRKDLMDDKLPHRKAVEVELVDCLIRIFDYAGEYDLDLDGAFHEKNAYNDIRADHKIEARMAANGKKW